jgi:hypothetical protein
MRRLFRILFNSISLLSFLLFLTTAVFWIRSRGYSESFEWAVESPNPVMRHLIFEDARLCFLRYRTIEGFDWRLLDPTWKPNFQHRREPFDADFTALFLPAAAPAVRRWHDFAWLPETTIEYFGIRIHMWAIPLWCPLLLTAILPLARTPALVRRINVRQRRNRGHCTRCGYDLRATPDRCPECGAMSSLS